MVLRPLNSGFANFSTFFFISSLIKYSLSQNFEILFLMMFRFILDMFGIDNGHQDDRNVYK